MSARTWTMRCTAMLTAELTDLDERAARRAVAEHAAANIDGGLGQLAIAAIAAQPAGPARVVEAERWSRRAVELGLDQVARVITGASTDDELDAHVEFELALRRRSA